MNQDKGILLLPKILMAILVGLPFFSHAQDNPFEFKEERPVVQAPVQQVVKQDPNLSQEQRMQVADMIKKTLSSMEIKDEGSRTVTIEEKEYIILTENESLKGVTSGLFAVYSEKTMDFEFYDTQKYAKVISMEEYKQLKLSAQQKVGLVLDSIREGITGISGLDSQLEPVSRSSSLDGQLEPISKISGVEIQLEPMLKSSGVEIQLEPVSNGSGLAPIEID
jgi:hypothetical protein